MKIAASEAQWDTCTHCPFSLFQIGGFTRGRPDAELLDRDPRRALLSSRRTRWAARSLGLNEVNQQEQKQFARQNGRNQSYLPPVEAIYWSMRGMAYAGSLVALIAIVGAILYRRRKLEQWGWFCWIAVAGAFLPFVATTFGWLLTELGRQPWIVQGLLLTKNANSPAVSTTWIAISLTVFICPLHRPDRRSTSG